MLSGLLAAWVGTLAEQLHGRNAWRLQRLVVGVILAQGRRTVTSWFRAAGITRGYRSYYYFLAALGLKVQAVGLSLFELSIQRIPIEDRLTLALDDTPTKRHGPKIEAAGRHHNPTPGPSGAKTLYGHNWVVLARLVKHAHSHLIGLALWATLYVRRCDVPSLPRGVEPWVFRTKLELAAAMIAATADALKDRWSGPVWLLTDGGYAKRPVYAATRKAGWVMVTRLRRDAHLNDLPPVSKPGQKRGRGRPRIYGTGRIKLSLRAGQKRGWGEIEVVMSGGKAKRWEVKTFLATWRVAGGVVRVVIIREEGDRSNWRAYVCSDPGATVEEVAQGVADRWGIEQVNHDVKEAERIGAGRPRWWTGVIARGTMPSVGRRTRTGVRLYSGICWDLNFSDVGSVVAVREKSGSCFWPWSNSLPETSPSGKVQLPNRLSLILLVPVPHADTHHAARGERRFCARL
jgi:hypothetical protein